MTRGEAPPATADENARTTSSRQGVSCSARRHSLGVLVELLGTAGETLPGVVGDLNRLTPFGTTFRYDEGFSGASFDRSEWLTTIRTLREFVESRMKA